MFTKHVMSEVYYVGCGQKLKSSHTHKPKFLQTALKLIKRRPQADRNYKWKMTFYSVNDSGSMMSLTVKDVSVSHLILSTHTFSPLTDLPETQRPLMLHVI